MAKLNLNTFIGVQYRGRNIMIREKNDGVYTKLYFPEQNATQTSQQAGRLEPRNQFDCLCH